MNNMLIRKIRTLGHKECCNFIDEKCIEDRACAVINPRYPTIHDGAVDCDYFLECVLPASWELNDLIAYALWYDGDDDEGDLDQPVLRRHGDADAQQPPHRVALGMEVAAFEADAGLPAQYHN